MTAYTATVGHAVATTTVTATPMHAGATVVIEDATGSTTGTSRTMPLSVGANPVFIVVTAEDGQTTQTYTVTVTRAAVPTPGPDLPLPGQELPVPGPDLPGPGEALLLPEISIVAGQSPIPEGTPATFRMEAHGADDSGVGRVRLESH